MKAGNHFGPLKKSFYQYKNKNVCGHRKIKMDTSKAQKHHVTPGKGSEESFPFSLLKGLL